MLNVKVKKNSDDYEDVFNNVIDYIDLSFEMEEKREKSLIEQSGRMITSFSIVSAGLLVIYRILREYEFVSVNYLNFFTAICLFLLVASMILAVFVQWRWKYENLPSPSDIYNHIVSNKESFNTVKLRVESYSITLNNTYKSKKKLNDKRAKLVTASMILFLLSIATSVLAALYQIIILCFFN